MKSKLFVFALAIFVCTGCSTVSEIENQESIVFRTMEDTQDLLAANSFFDFFDESLVEYTSINTLSEEEIAEVRELTEMGLYYMSASSNDFQNSYAELEALGLSSRELSGYVGAYLEEEIGFGGTGGIDVDALACGTSNWLWSVVGEPIGLIVAGLGCDVEGSDNF